ncbi:hypothetical protein [Streptomyces scabiei]
MRSAPVPRYRARRREPSHTWWWPEDRHTGIWLDDENIVPR